jgi:hypothetical protein
MGTITFGVRGTTPLIAHRFSDKARRQLLLPGKRKNKAGLESALKHDPVHEFRQALYMNRDKASPTLCHLPAPMFSKAIASAALDMPGAAKAKILRLVSIVDETVNLYGVPHLYMRMVRQSGISRTPDVRTRPCFRNWACTVTVEYPIDVVTSREIFALYSGAGHIVGVGDWRAEKGGRHGKFVVVQTDDAGIADIMTAEARAAQQRAYDTPIAFGEETQELLDWYSDEIVNREQDDQLTGLDEEDEDTLEDA